MGKSVDTVELAQALIQCPSVTPVEGGALDHLQAVLEDLGFTAHRLTFETPGTEPVDNLYARLGSNGRNFCYAGHTDVVPVGNAAAWSADPFGAELRDGLLYGRGAVDMKGSIAAFVAAAAGFLGRCDDAGRGLDGSISLLITGDEEAIAVNGTVRVLDWLAARGEKLDQCLVGEPTSVKQLGDTVKIGRRGSMNGVLTVYGVQGHSAYPEVADNPLHHLVRMLEPLVNEPLDQGSEHFPPTTLQFTSIDVGNPASNIIPAECCARFDVRFSDQHSGKSVERWIRDRLDREGARYDLKITLSGEAFLCPPGAMSDLVAGAIEAETGSRPTLATTGGTSDARFIKDHCPVAEFGLLNWTAHKVDERTSVEDLRALTRIYQRILENYFA